MIRSIELTRFKKYKQQTFSINPAGVSLLVGGNNSGKTTLIHALAVWEFCKMILLHEKGRKIFNETEVGKGEGFGMSAEEFLPIAVPTLNHLWTNLKTQLSTQEKQEWDDPFPGYLMRINCMWDYENQKDKHLEIGLSLTNDRLFMRITKSNLTDEDHLLNIVYLPTFAGILPKENKVTHAERRAFLGRGMAGSIIRNMVYDLYEKDRELREKILGNKKHLSKADNIKLSTESPLVRLQNNLTSTFGSILEIEPFNENFHTILKVNERKAVLVNDSWEALPKTQYTPRDIITQGSGFLQWLSIFSILYNANTDVLLLDEPDAHLHATLQEQLLDKLIGACMDSEKQILVSTHSVEIIKQAPLSMIYSMDKKDYLYEEGSRVATLKGIGSEYFPKLAQLEKYKKIIFVENQSDEKILKIMGEKCGLEMPTEVVYWASTDGHADRRFLFNELKKQIPDLKCVSLRDRDMDNVKTVDENLNYKGITIPADEGMLLLEWRRKNIESYLLCPKAISIVSEKPVEEVKEYFSSHFAIALKDDGFTESNPPEPILTLDGKHIFMAKDIGLEECFHCTKYDVASHMTSDEVCEDIKIFIRRVQEHFHS